jgi:hydrogenase maturation factor
VLRIIERDGSAGIGVDRDGNRTRIELDFVPGARAGDSVLAHFGVAIALVPQGTLK